MAVQNICSNEVLNILAIIFNKGKYPYNQKGNCSCLPVMTFTGSTADKTPEKILAITWFIEAIELRLRHHRAGAQTGQVYGPSRRVLMGAARGRDNISSPIYKRPVSLKVPRGDRAEIVATSAEGSNRPGVGPSRRLLLLFDRAQQGGSEGSQAVATTP